MTFCQPVQCATCGVPRGLLHAYDPTWTHCQFCDSWICVSCWDRDHPFCSEGCQLADDDLRDKEM